MALLVAFLLASVSPATAVVSKGFLASNQGLQPQVVAKTLFAVEDKWRQQSLDFVACNSTSRDGVACQDVPKAFVHSCGTVVNAMFQASSGDRAALQEYLADVCGQDQLQGWRRETCHSLSNTITASMTADAYENREDLDASAPCQSFWLRFMGEEKVRVARENAGRAREEKRLTEEEVKAAAEAKTKADAEAERQAKEKAAREVEESVRQQALEAKRLQVEAKVKAAQVAAKKMAVEMEAKKAATEKKEAELKKQMEEAQNAVEEAQQVSVSVKTTQKEVLSAKSPVTATKLANSTQPPANVTTQKVQQLKANTSLSALAINKHADPCDGITCAASLKCPGGFKVTQIEGHCCPYCVNPDIELKAAITGASGETGGKASVFCDKVWCFPTMCAKAIQNPSEANGQCCPVCPR